MSHAALIDLESERTLPAFAGGDGGGNMTDNLVRRVGKLEQDVAAIRQDVNILTIRSENFATKVDIANICTEMATMRGEFKEEMAAMRGEFKSDMAAMRGEFKEETAAMRGEFKEEMAAMRGEFKEETAAMRGEFRSDMATMCGGLKTEISTIHGKIKEEMANTRGYFHEELRKAISKQTVLLLTVIPATLAAIAAVGAWFR